MTALGGGLALAGGALCLPALMPRAEGDVGGEREADGRHHAWVWQFSEDGSPEIIRDVLAAYGLGVILKTHDGSDWMARWDKSPTAIAGPAQVSGFATFFESVGVPFHAWCVVSGRDPVAEARLCSDVLSAGARSIVLDLEPAENRDYWHGTPDSALIFGEELRRRQPRAHVTVAPDPRPWQVQLLPMREFASFSDDLAPQTYWRNFDNPANYRLLNQWGFPVGREGVTPELVLDMAVGALGEHGLPIRPIAPGSAEPEPLRRFVEHAFQLGMEAVSVWRYGVSRPDVWPLLRELAPRPPEAVAAPAPPPAPPEPIVVAQEPEALSTAEPPPAVSNVESTAITGTDSGGDVAPALRLPSPSASSPAWKGLAGGMMALAGAALVSMRGLLQPVGRDGGSAAG